VSDDLIKLMAMQRQHSVVERIKILSVAPGEHYCPQQRLRTRGRLKAIHLTPILEPRNGGGMKGFITHNPD